MAIFPFSLIQDLVSVMVNNPLPSTGKSMRVLVADDDRGICDLYRIALQAKGHDVTLTYDGRECVRAYKETQKQHTNDKESAFDVVVLDYQMPNIDGLEAAKEILRINKKHLHM
jgi:CheY-like chemotaxis protein